jgi:hypothetical protein
MFNIAKRAIFVVFMSAVSLSGAYAASANSVDILKYIPADTPYVVASTEPLPAKLAAKLEPTIDELLQGYQGMLRYVLEDQLAKMSAEEGGEEQAEQFRGLMEEVLNLVSLQGIRDAGFDRESAFAFYGNGLMPVLRLELSDPKLFDAVVKRIDEKAGGALQVAEAKGAAYSYISAEQLKLIITTHDDQAIITAIPASYDEAQVAAALGIKAPRKSLKKSKTLRAIGKQYGYSEYLTGFIDTQRIAGMFAGNATPQDEEFFAAVGATPPVLTEVCSAEIMEMAGIAPRVVFGYSTLTTEHIKSSLIVELREDIAEGLATVPAAVPGLGIDTGGFMSLGLGLNPMAIREFSAARLDAMEADPYKCEHLAELQGGVAKGREALNQPLPPVVYSFRGFVANIADIQGLDFVSNTPPTSVDASILVAIENAEALVMMAAMMDPQVAAMNLLPDGKPVRLELAQLAELADDVFAALSSNALAISLGNGAEKDSANMLLADSAKPIPFMSMNLDAERYYAMLEEVMSQEPVDEDEEETPKELRDAMNRVMLLSGSMYERMSVDVLFTERGIEIGAIMKLSD